ncbi:tRNA(Ile)(2)-agmatinylcytidine synthase [Haloarchaeobius iranensis]|uniref:tRNA(Ile2) 2-agmatinylcytidine synthetase TiaS n=1 Tax=Haloarchaeobius iranensis TaxID=996166 RepID=A0A1G9VHY6_9EURY|nr:tRNA(Ile)(2)-agmatinylcytidine synthase [Haloarchaeobius iranensis]SDM71898.1 tRNA(Ile2) 2-agmatinylcytidine synthetase [Haloarchaeobius iranensis]
MTVIGLDDTDSRELGMCTTYVASRVADRVSAAGGRVVRVLLVRLNPAVEHKTRGNAALAVHCDLPPERAAAIAREELAVAETDDPRTNPGFVVAPGSPERVSDGVAAFARDALREIHAIDDAVALADESGYRHGGRGNARGTVGALAAVGAWAAFDDWTYEQISYREPDRLGTERDVDLDSLFAAADRHYPDAWDTVDRVEGEAVCVPRTPCPILHGIRGDDPDAVRALASEVQSEPVHDSRLFVTNQGTDAHLAAGELGALDPKRGWRVDGTVLDEPETREGGHVFVAFGEPDGPRVDCAAFEPTKRFRDRVRALRPGDRLTVCGEVSDGTLKLEKFAVRELDRTEHVTPACPDCGRTMESAGRNQGYRCRDCGTSTDGKVETTVERDLEPGWYEVPPCARRHVAKPLVRGGFDAETHPER